MSRIRNYPFRGLSAFVLLTGSLTAAALAQQPDWPPAPALPAHTAAEDATSLPPSITAEYLGRDEWRCTFSFRPSGEAEKVVVAGSFNTWDRQAEPMSGPDENGEWRVSLDLGTGVYEYKFLVDDELWCSDGRNPDRVPDGFGGQNSLVRLGQLARMKESEQVLGDGEISTLGLAHRPSQLLYLQPVGKEDVSIRYRTLAHDVQKVWLAIRGRDPIEMQVLTEGPLFSYYGTRVRMAGPEKAGNSRARGIEYTFVLDDGGEQRVCDPHVYYRGLTTAGLFEAPEWARQAVWYQIMVDRFRNGDRSNDPEHVRPWTSEWFTPSDWEGQDGQTFYNLYVFERFYGGDIAGLESQLPYLKGLGVNAIYLMPVFKSPSNHKYDVQNYLHIDDGFGMRGDYEEVAAQENLLDPETWQWTQTDRRFLAFVDKAHQMGFHIILDGVFNHVGDRHPAYEDVKANGRNSPYADWFDVVSWAPFQCNGWAGFAHMPLLRKSRSGFASPTLKEHIFNVTRRWMDPDGDGDPRDGIDGWRLDVPGDVPSGFWAEWCGYVKGINPEAFITGEVWNRGDQWLDGLHFDSVTNYEFARVATAWIFNREQKTSAGQAASRLAELRLAYPEGANHVLLNLVSGHDTDRLASMAHNPDREYDRQNRVQDNNPDYDNSKPSPHEYARARLVALLQMTYVGAPMIFYGDEAGMWGADDPSNRKPMLWADLEPYDKPEENHVLTEQLEFYKRAIALRNEHAALRDGALQTLLVDDAADVWAFLRSTPSEQMLVVLNASDAPRVVHVPLPDGAPASWTGVFGAAGTSEATEGLLTINVPAISGVVLTPAG